MVSYVDNAFYQNNSREADWNDPNLDLRKYSGNGVNGDVS